MAKNKDMQFFMENSKMEKGQKNFYPIGAGIQF